MDLDVKKMDLSTVLKEIKTRQDLLQQMVGTLYTSIVRGELYQLYSRRDELLKGEQITKTLKQNYKDWKINGPYVPGKTNYYTFALTKDEIVKIVHVNQTNTLSYYEDLNMLKELENALNMFKLDSSYFEDCSKWESLIINRRKPHTYRVFMYLPNQLRVCLHKFNPCDEHEALLHPHPWPGAFAILSGKYEMEIGYSKDRVSSPEHVTKLVLASGSKYEIVSPLTWHAVIPLETTYTIMVNGPAWDETYAHKDIRTTKGKDLDRMPEKELREHLNIFKELVAR